MKCRKEILRWLDRAADAVFMLVVVGMIWVVLQVGYIAPFTIPTDSMMPAAVPGDRIIVNKLVMGGRIFNMLKPLRGERFNVMRLPALGKLHRDDAVVFNFPYRHRWDSVGMDVNLYYMKRIVALPGDTVRIKGCRTFVSEYSGEGKPHIQHAHGYIPGQDELADLVGRYSTEEPDMSRWPIVMKAFPNDSLVGWTVSDFGPLFVPRKGSTIFLNPENVAIYGRYIEWETAGKLMRENDNNYRIAGIGVTDRYTFRENYYFTQGDNAASSKDSRYWGLLPEPFIVGKVAGIWDSKTGKAGKRRWYRIGKSLKI